MSGEHRRLRPAIVRALGDSGADLAGIALFALGVVAAMGIWAGAAGPVGEWVDLTARVTVGKAALVAPLLLAGLGVILVLGKSVEHTTRMVLGAAIAFLAALALLHLVGGVPRFGEPWEVVAEEGGYFGAFLAVPLSFALGAAAAGVVCAALLVSGLLLASGLRLRTLAGFGKKLVERLRARAKLEDEGPDEESGRAALSDASAGAETSSSVSAELYDGQADHDTEPEDEDDKPSAATRAAKIGGGEEGSPKQLELGVPRLPDGELYELPDLALLRRSHKKRVDHTVLEERGDVIQETLREFSVGATLVGIVAGPTVTRYEVELDQGVKVNQLTNLTPDIQYALATPEVRVIAPIPGRSAIGFEVPNLHRQLVTAGDILASQQLKEDRHPLTVALGRNISGKPVVVNLGEMPHLLIAGATGSGKSSCINAILTSVLCRSRPSEVRLILIDPKRVELGRFERLPHLLTGVVSNPKRAADALAWAVEEMERRYEILANAGTRDLTSYNAGVDRGEITDAAGEAVDRLPYILVVVDELSDLMQVAPRNVEDSVARLAQMARAVGLHLIIATQRPSVDVITGVIKANIPTRMAFKVRTVTDSRVILDQAGADKLVGQGDFLYLGASAGQTERIQSCFVSEGEVAKIVGHWRDQVHRVAESRAAGRGTEDEAAEQDDVDDAKAADRPASVGKGESSAEAASAGTGDVVFSGNFAVATRPDVGDELLVDAMELVVMSQLGSTSMLQRKLRVGFARGGRIMDLLEERGIVGPSLGSKARDVLVTPEQLDEVKQSL